jgi:polysaccharide export outer membrane protein
MRGLKLIIQECTPANIRVNQLCFRLPLTESFSDSTSEHNEGKKMNFRGPNSVRKVEAPNPARLALSHFIEGILLLLIALFLIPSAKCESISNAKDNLPVSASSPSDSTNQKATDSYRLGPEDVLSVQVEGHPEMNADALVLGDGSVTIPRIGRLQVSGETLPNAEKSIRQEFAKVLLNPIVSVSVHAAKVDKVFVFGDVVNPGPVEFKPGWKVAQAIASAGGLKARPDWIRLTLMRKDGETESLSPEKLLQNPEGDENVAMAPGDMLFVQEIPPRQIFVSGAVEKPGIFDIRTVDPKRESIGVLEALALAGGPTPKAALSQSYILRADPKGAASADPREEEKINIAALQGKPTAAGTLPPAKSPDTAQLYAGDTLYVPESSANIVVLGMVKNPGVYPISEDVSSITLAQAIGMAGGTIERAKVTKIGIIRPPSQNAGPGAKPSLTVVDMNKMRSKDDTQQVAPVYPGDVVYVPQDKNPDWFGKVVPGLSGVLQILVFGGHVF